MFKDTGFNVPGTVREPWIKEPTPGEAAYQAFWDAASQGGEALEIWRQEQATVAGIAFDSLAHVIPQNAEHRQTA